MLVYVTDTGTRDVTERMDGILTRHGFRVAVMKADAVAPNRREKWVADKVQEGIDVMICRPRLVQTGLDLIDFPAIVWDETEFSVFQSREKSTVLVGDRFGFLDRQRHTIGSLSPGSNLRKLEGVLKGTG